MNLPVLDVEVILFDMNGTLRMREPHEPTQRAAIERVQTLLGMNKLTVASLDEFARRQKQYSHWAQENLIQLSEAEIWAQWILPDYPSSLLEPVAAELMLAWSERKGRTIPKPGATEMLVELKQRGYRLGLISNSMSTLDIPHSLDSYGWKDYFEVVILSSIVKIRKPAPEVFWEATRILKVEPSRCAYVGNRLSRDVAGCKRAGFALGIVVEQTGKPQSHDQDQGIRPDVVISSLNELLDLFPGRSSIRKQA